MMVQMEVDQDAYDQEQESDCGQCPVCVGEGGDVVPRGVGGDRAVRLEALTVIKTSCGRSTILRL